MGGDAKRRAQRSGSGGRVKYSKGKPPRWYDRATGSRRHRFAATHAALERLAKAKQKRAARGAAS